jgi:hypothetical protein
MSQDRGDLGEQTLSKIAEVALNSQVDEAEAINVDLRTDPLKLVQGELESVAIEGQGIVVQQELRMAEIQLQTNAVAINPLSAVLGKIELTRPTEASAEITLTATDINRAFNSDFIRQKMQGLKISVDGKPVTISVQKVDFDIPENGKISLNAEIFVRETGELKQVAFTAVPKVSSDRQQVLLENVEFTEDRGDSQELTSPLLEQMRDLLNLQNFELQGMDLRLEKIQAEAGKLTMVGSALIEEFPSDK